MIVKEKIGNIHNRDIAGRQTDIVHIEWFETGRRIIHKRAESGREVICKFLNQPQQLTDGDILFEDESIVVTVDVTACDALVIKVEDQFQLASVCYEIGNKHMPLFYENGELLVPFDSPLQRLLIAQGYQIEKQQRKLLHPLKTTVTPHGDGDGSSLFSKIMKLTTT